MSDRDARGRFMAGNQFARAGGQARAAKLSPRRRKTIARKARRAMVRKHFAGDDRAQRKYFAGTPVPVRAAHPGPIQEWRSRYYQLDLLNDLHRDVEF